MIFAVFSAEFAGAPIFPLNRLSPINLFDANHCGDYLQSTGLDLCTGKGFPGSQNNLRMNLDRNFSKQMISLFAALLSLFIFLLILIPKFTKSKNGRVHACKSCWHPPLLIFDWTHRCTKFFARSNGVALGNILVVRVGLFNIFQLYWYLNASDRKIRLLLFCSCDKQL